MSEALAGHVAQIDRNGVQVFLYAANRGDASAAKLLAMRRKLKSLDTPTADALWDGVFALSRECETHIERLRDRGGLLHFRHAQVLRTIDGQYRAERAAR